MDRTLILLDREGDLHAQIDFIYDDLAQEQMQCTLYGKNYDSSGGVPIAIVFPLSMFIYPLPFTKFGSIHEIRLHDIDIVKNELKDHIKDVTGFTFTYSEQTVHHRYIVTHENNCLAIVDCHSNFVENTKTIKLISAISPRYDTTVTGNSLECNIEAILNLSGHEVPEQDMMHVLLAENIKRLR